jgi:hypothetical protein
MHWKKQDRGLHIVSDFQVQNESPTQYSTQQMADFFTKPLPVADC